MEIEGQFRRKEDKELLQAVEDARQDQRRALRNAAIGYLILLASVTVGAYKLEGRTDERLRISQLAACERVNNLRGRVNTLNEVAWRAFDDGVQRERRLRRLTSGRTSRLHAQSATRLVAIRDALTVQAFVLCPQAVDQPLTYHPPHLRPVKK